MTNRMTYMHSGQLNAPQMNGASGSNGQLLQVLDACLIDGFNVQTASSASLNGGVVSINYGTPHGYANRQLITISGANDAKLNGSHRILSKTENSLTIDATGVTQTTGVIKTKVTPLDFQSIFGSSEPLKRAYRSKNTQSTQTVLYLDMSLPTGHGYNSSNPVKRAMVSMCEDMTTLGVQINSYTNTKNNYTKNKNGTLLWYQARGYSKTEPVTSTANSNWVIAGNGDRFYFFPIWQTYDVNLKLHRDFFAFGDMPSMSSSDAFNCFWAGIINENDANGIYWALNGAKIGGNPSAIMDYNGYHAPIGFFIRSKEGVGDLQSSVLTFSGFESNLDHTGFGGGTSLSFPNPASNSLISMPLYIMSKNSLRAQALGLNGTPQDMLNNHDLDLTTIDSQLLVMTSKNGYSNADRGFFVIDLRG